MSEAPERIWTASTEGKCHVGFDNPSMNYTNEYIRADIHANTLAANAALVARIAALEAVVAAGDGLAALVADEEMPDWMVRESLANEIDTHDWLGIRKALTTYRAAKDAANG